MRNLRVVGLWGIGEKRDLEGLEGKLKRRVCGIWGGMVRLRVWWW